jgi:hypothetical protein
MEGGDAMDVDTMGLGKVAVGVDAA